MLCPEKHQQQHAGDAQRCWDRAGAAPDGAGAKWVQRGEKPQSTGAPRLFQGIPCYPLWSLLRDGPRGGLASRQGSGLSSEPIHHAQIARRPPGQREQHGAAVPPRWSRGDGLPRAEPPPPGSSLPASPGEGWRESNFGAATGCWGGSGAGGGSGARECEGGHHMALGWLWDSVGSWGPGVLDPRGPSIQGPCLAATLSRDNRLLA